MQIESRAIAPRLVAFTLSFLSFLLLGGVHLIGLQTALLHAEQPPSVPSDNNGLTLPFPSTPSASEAGTTVLDSKMNWRVEPQRLKPDAPNILIVLIDDVGFAQTDTFGGEIHTPTLSRLAKEGISYNRFHTTSICSPTRAALLTGRNHHRVGSGTIAERASDFDGYTGVIPRTSATIAEVLHHYGYRSSAFGKWHNTPANQTTSMGPFDRWPTGHGFDYFYGFLAGETSQFEPRLYENLNPIEPPHDEAYHLTEDIAENAIVWLKQHQSFAPDKPFLMYWAPGAVHGPHHVSSHWADKYKHKFDDGWDAMRQRIFERQKTLGWIPKNTQLTPRPDSLASWESIPESQRTFQTRLMEVFAGFVEHTDTQVGKIIDSLDDLGLRENTLVFYIWGDNGASAEGQRGSISELLAQNNIPNTVEQQIEALEGLGGLQALGSAKTDNMFHAGWAWAGNAPMRSTKLVAAHFGGTRNPMVVSWPRSIKPDEKPRSQFHHVNDIAPTIYEAAGIRPPDRVAGYEQDPIDGKSMVYSFADADAKDQKTTQYFENNASRGIYHDGWFACTFGPFLPWDTPSTSARLKAWVPEKEVWELYHVAEDFSQANDLAKVHPERLEDLKKRFLAEARKNKVLPIGGGLWTRFHPDDVISSPYTFWRFDATTRRMPEFTAPGLGKKSNVVKILVDVEENASGVLYALGGNSGGITLFMEEGQLVYEYNMLLLERYRAVVSSPVPAGKHTIEIETDLTRPGAPADVVIRIDGNEASRVRVDRTVPAAFTASETFDVGIDLGSPVALDYAEKRPFEFEGTIEEMTVTLK